MSVVRWRVFTVPKSPGLCATCTWGLVRAGFRANQEETFCRLVTPNALVSFPVSRCTEYVDRRATVLEGKPEGRKIGFVTELKL
ncbi:MAG TPA: hypothetical protein VFA13_10180 [Candidatus Acidoferrum sp.]|nr:hypothetical protein [Candidatus Acidoferrum sp.]